ncbi:hypothetical protein AALP_AA7G054000 [Arabis alpina]|uniref:Uncharacterized protein n=1 Tax=Arabis alpina TaxID=50452 RepID=A0A087GG23_ARAAL|nr:hypothetical protein AALP_AA7G054000 [Arabis alpina]
MVPKDPTSLDEYPDDPRSSVCTKQDDPRSSALLPYPNEVHDPLQDYTDEQMPSVLDEVGPTTSPPQDPKTQPETEAPMPPRHVDDPTWTRVEDIGVNGVIGIGGAIPFNDEDPNLPFGRAEASSSSSSSDSGASSEESDEEDSLIEVEQTKRAKKIKKKAKAKVHPDPPGSSLSNEKSLTRLRKKCGISEEIMLVAPTPTDRADAPPPGYKTLEGSWARLGEVSLREQIALEAAAKARGSSGTRAPRVAMPTTSTPPTSLVQARTSRPSAPQTALPPPSAGDVAEFRRLSAEGARISSGKGKGIDRMTPLKRQRVDSFPVAAVGGESSARGGDGLLRDEAYSVVKSRYTELSLLFDRLIGDYDEDVCSKDSELSATKEANAALESRLDETVERNEALERDALALHRVKKDYEDKLAKLKSRCAKAEESRDEMSLSFVERTSEVVGLLTEIGGKAHNNMLNLTDIDANLEFIGLLWGPHPPGLSTEVKALRERRRPVYDAHDVFADLLAGVRRVLEIPTAPAGAAETSATVDDDVEVSDEDDVEATDEDEGAED